jgi:hypothetical protein
VGSFWVRTGNFPDRVDRAVSGTSAADLLHSAIMQKTDGVFRKDDSMRSGEMASMIARLVLSQARPNDYRG